MHAEAALRVVAAMPAMPGPLPGPDSGDGGATAATAGLSVVTGAGVTGRRCDRARVGGGRGAADRVAQHTAEIASGAYREAGRQAGRSREGQRGRGVRRTGGD